MKRATSTERQWGLVFCPKKQDLVVLLGELWQGSGKRGGCVFWGGACLSCSPTHRSSGPTTAALFECFVNIGGAVVGRTAITLN